MFLPNDVNDSLGAVSTGHWVKQAQDWANSNLGSMMDGPAPSATTAIVRDPHMAGKFAVLSEMLPPEWNLPLQTFVAANDASLGEMGIQQGVALLTQGLAGNLSIAGLAGQFLGPEAQKAAAAAMSLMKGDPIGAVLAVLPPEAREAAAIAGPLLSGDLGGALSAVAGKFLPPELLPVWDAAMKSGLLEEPFAMASSMLPSPFAKPEAPAQPSVEETPSEGEGCGMAPLAARISDIVSCPKGGGPIITGQPDVLVGFMPAARRTDKALCVGPPDVITDGEPTVQIGGNDASRLADATAHGGNILSGLDSVWIGKSHAPCMTAAAARRAAIMVNGPSGV